MKKSFKQYLKEFVHNVFVNPLLMFIPIELLCKFHNINAIWGLALDRYHELKLEKVKKHNKV